MEYICKYCGRECKSKNSLIQHEIRCKSNPDRIQCFGNKQNMPKHFNNTKVRLSDGTQLDITRNELDQYRESHQVCEICGRTIEECVHWESKYAPKQFCIDHDHNTLKFRGLLCSRCNRQLGWYEKHKTKIEEYLNKEA